MLWGVFFFFFKGGVYRRCGKVNLSQNLAQSFIKREYILETLSSVWERNLQYLPVFVAPISAKMDYKCMFALPVN